MKPQKRPKGDVCDFGLTRNFKVLTPARHPSANLRLGFHGYLRFAGRLNCPGAGLNTRL